MRLAWLHSDCMNGRWFRPEDKAVFVFDDAQVEAAGWGLKRLVFLYETLLELKVEIHRGPVVDTLAALGSAYGGVVTVDTPDPWLRARLAELRGRVRLEVAPAPVFVELEGRVDLKRFSRYWRKAEPKLLA